MTSLEQLDRATGMIVEADRLIREILGENNFVSRNITDVLDYLGEEMAEIESEEEYDGQPDEAQEWHDFDPEC